MCLCLFEYDDDDDLKFRKKKNVLRIMSMHIYNAAAACC